MKWATQSTAPFKAEDLGNVANRDGQMRRILLFDNYYLCHNAS
jgi:hypothetical protein